MANLCAPSNSAVWRIRSSTDRSVGVRFRAPIAIELSSMVLPFVNDSLVSRPRPTLPPAVLSWKKVW
jgi:hypothetical protein